MGEDTSASSTFIRNINTYGMQEPTATSCTLNEALCRSTLPAAVRFIFEVLLILLPQLL
jgi:hypothetical protein